MELNRCSRCGAFYTDNGDVCPKCSNKDNLEFSTFKSYIEQNGISSINNIATNTGIAQKNVTRFFASEGLTIENDAKTNLTNSGIVMN